MPLPAIFAIGHLSISNLKSELLCEFDSRLTQALDAVRNDVFVILDRGSALTHTSNLDRPPTSNIAAVTPISCRPSDMDHASQNAPQRNAPKRRLDDFTPPALDSAAPLHISTAPISPSSRTVLTIPMNAPNYARFWLYITQIAPSVSDQEVKKMVIGQLGTDDVIIIKLRVA